MEPSYTPEQIVQMDKESIYLGNLYTVDADLELPVEGKLGSMISCRSDNEHLRMLYNFRDAACAKLYSLEFSLSCLF